MKAVMFESSRVLNLDEDESFDFRNGNSRIYIAFIVVPLETWINNFDWNLNFGICRLEIEKMPRKQFCSEFSEVAFEKLKRR